MNKNFEVNAMRAYEVDDYFTIVANNKNEALEFHKKEMEGMMNPLQ